MNKIFTNEHTHFRFNPFQMRNGFSLLSLLESLKKIKQGPSIESGMQKEVNITFPKIEEKKKEDI